MQHKVECKRYYDITIWLKTIKKQQQKTIKISDHKMNA